MCLARDQNSIYCATIGLLIEAVFSVMEQGYLKTQKAVSNSFKLMLIIIIKFLTRHS